MRKTKKVTVPKILTTKKQIAEIQWFNNPKKNDAIRVGKCNEFWILSQKAPGSPILLYDQAEWDSFIDGVTNDEFDALVKERR